MESHVVLTHRRIQFRGNVDQPETHGTGPDRSGHDDLPDDVPLFFPRGAGPEAGASPMHVAAEWAARTARTSGFHQESCLGSTAIRTRPAKARSVRSRSDGAHFKSGGSCRRTTPMRARNGAAWVIRRSTGSSGSCSRL